MSTPTHSDAIEALFSEARRFPPPPEFAAQANAQPGIYEQAERDYLAWWKSWADQLEWMTPPTKVLEWDEPFARWFGDGELNASVNASTATCGPARRPRWPSTTKASPATAGR